MSSFFSQDNLLQKVKADTKESIIKQLLDAENYETKTEIPNALAMSVADLLAVYYTNPEKVKKLLNIEDNSPVLTGDLISYILARFRINMISKDRQSRAEATQALQGIQSEESTTSAFKKMFGL